MNRVSPPRRPSISSGVRALAMLALTVLAQVLALPRASAQAAGPEAAPNPEDVLGNIVVVAGATRSLPKVAVLPSLASDLEDVTLRNVVRRDLDLCGEFEVLSDSAAPDGLYLSDTPIDVRAWAGKGVEALVRVSGRPGSAGKAELRGQAFFVSRGASPVFDKAFEVPQPSVRVAAHRIADLLIGALTGQNGAFASHMTFASGSGSQRRVYTIDADGNDAKAASPAGQVAIAPAFGKDGQLFYAASIDHDAYRVLSPSGGPFSLPVKGSVYGIAFSRDASKVAVSVGTDNGIFVFAGAGFDSVAQASKIGTALHPVFTPSGLLAFSGEGKFGQRIYVEDKPISPEGLFASSPTFCANPDGVRAVFAVGAGKNTDLVSTGERGGQLARLTQNQGKNSYPACSPDGRLIAFFTTRTSNEGPGLYVMRADGGRPKRVSTLLGDSLRWDALPAGSVEMTAK